LVAVVLDIRDQQMNIRFNQNEETYIGNEHPHMVTDSVMSHISISFKCVKI